MIGSNDSVHGAPEPPIRVLAPPVARIRQAPGEPPIDLESGCMQNCVFARGGTPLRSAGGLPKRYFGCGNNLGALFWPRRNPGRAIWPRKNPGRAILAAEKPWARCLGCGKTLGALFWLRKIPGRAVLAAEKPCARAHSGNLTHRLCISDT